MKWEYAISPKGWINLTREQKRKTSGIIANVYEYKRYKERGMAHKEAQRVQNQTGIPMEVVEVITSGIAL